MEIERYEWREELKANIDYERFRREHPCDDIDNLLELMLDMVCSTAPTIRSGGQRSRPPLPFDAYVSPVNGAIGP